MNYGDMQNGQKNRQLVGFGPVSFAIAEILREYRQLGRDIDFGWCCGATGAKLQDERCLTGTAPGANHSYTWFDFGRRREVIETTIPLDVAVFLDEFKYQDSFDVLSDIMQLLSVVHQRTRMKSENLNIRTALAQLVDNVLNAFTGLPSTVVNDLILEFPDQIDDLCVTASYISVVCDLPAQAGSLVERLGEQLFVGSCKRVMNAMADHKAMVGT